MTNALKRNRAVWLAAGVLLGLAAASFLPHSPAHAVATDRMGDFAIATGPLDDQVEAIYFLDFLTGDLRAAALNLYTWKFGSLFATNVIDDLGIELDKNPRYLLVTGNALLKRNAGPITPGSSAVYVAELTSGKIAAYVVPWSQAYNNSRIPIAGKILAVDVMKFRTAPIRDDD
ncbi:MAG TPA: hypothetical protein VGX76_01275 [Pirellulales bacterium]|jgi:hypothetical protein|nr:hypothetical protein [Pirellulales bacterium]